MKTHKPERTEPKDTKLKLSFIKVKVKAMEDESVKFLGKIFGLLNDGDVFVAHSYEPKSILDFHHPDELQVSFDKIRISRVKVT